MQDHFYLEVLDDFLKYIIWRIVSFVKLNQKQHLVYNDDYMIFWWCSFLRCPVADRRYLIHYLCLLLVWHQNLSFLNSCISNKGKAGSYDDDKMTMFFKWLCILTNCSGLSANLQDLARRRPDNKYHIFYLKDLKCYPWLPSEEIWKYNLQH